MREGDLTNPADGPAPANPLAPAWIVTSRQRDPQMFSGLPGDDVEDWLDDYNRVSAFNGWDDKLKLASVNFHLREVAKTWYLNNKEDLTDWSRFTADIRKIFGTSTLRSDAAKKKLAERVQHPAESYTSYIEDVLALCKRVNREMAESDRVKHILKGISSFAFNALAVQNPTTVGDVVMICQRLTDLQALRLQPASSHTLAPDQGDLRAMIRAIIREELHGQASSSFPLVQPQTFGSSLRDIIKEELASVTCSSPPKPEFRAGPAHSDSVVMPHIPSSPSVPEASHVHLAPVSAAYQPATYHAPYYPPWRPPRPTCYYCGIRGHISKFCRRRQRDECQVFSTPPRGDTRSTHDYRSQPFTYSRRRSPSPPDAADHRATSRSDRRRSPSPFRRFSSPLRQASQTIDRRTEN